MTLIFPEGAAKEAVPAAPRSGVQLILPATLADATKSKITETRTALEFFGIEDPKLLSPLGRHMLTAQAAQTDWEASGNSPDDFRRATPFISTQVIDHGKPPTPTQ